MKNQKAEQCGLLKFTNRENIHGKRSENHKGADKKVATKPDSDPIKKFKTKRTNEPNNHNFFRNKNS